MKKRLRHLLIYSFILFLISVHTQAQCTGGTNGGTISPSVSWQTTSVNPGQYYTFNVPAANPCPNTYVFTFCGNGASSTYDTQITILDNTGAYAGRYNDDFCSISSEVSWTAPLAGGTFRVLINYLYGIPCSNIGTASTLAFCNTTNLSSNYCFVGNATPDPSSGLSCVQLTQDAGNQVGCAWGKAPISLAADFDYTIQMYLGNKDGADGICFVLHRDPRGLSACGTAGAYLGAGGVNPSWITEFDTFDNGYSGEMGPDHVALEKNGVTFPPLYGPVALPELENGALHTYRFIWNASSKVYKVYLDGTLYLSPTYDIATNVFGGATDVIWGYTGSTGGATNRQYFCPINLPVLPVSLISFGAMSNNDKVFLHWSTASEKNNSHFEVEHSTDGKLFWKIGPDIYGVGNSTIQHDYDFTDINASKGINYYRLKQLDFDGNSSYSKILSVLLKTTNKDGATGVILNPIKAGTTFNITYHLEASNTIGYYIYNTTGQLILSKTTNYNAGDNEIEIRTDNLTPGIYLMQISINNGLTGKYKIVIQ